MLPMPFITLSLHFVLKKTNFDPLKKTKFDKNNIYVEFLIYMGHLNLKLNSPFYKEFAIYFLISVANDENN